MKTAIITSAIFLMNLGNSFSQLPVNNNAHLLYLISGISVNANTDTITNKLHKICENVKVQRAFISYFGENAENNWSKVGEKFLNCFHSNGLLTRALFTKHGQLIYVITYGTEKNLPVDIRRRIKREYFDYTIAVVIEVKENNRDIWVVKLDNTSEIITVRVEGDEMERVQ